MRPHIEFIQAQVLPWTPQGPASARPGTEMKTLSRDAETGAASMIVRYPAGWRMGEARALACDEELFVLKGAFAVNGVTYRKGDYAYLPAGFARRDMASPEGADVLVFFEGASRKVEANAAASDPTRLIEKTPSEEMAWGHPSDPTVAAAAKDAGRKVLREDPITKERTWLLKFGADDPAQTTHGHIERHPVVEELFLLSGEISMTCGVLKPGAYFWRPPHIPHGPFGSRTGLYGFFRCKGGPLTTQWSDEKRPIQWTADYKPTLPPELSNRAAQSYDPDLPY